ncbi:Zinc finger, C6HC-type [Corchorus olitorius]|uniref:RBR-type E3 ubiquitin transferase n=1 Tax=Corchorus olitorius TaxID=93759 RepID=A0A1R3H6M2_9ROSI|nr:Zinc finger, C6HC-type [Corchorus olitorius]
MFSTRSAYGALMEGDDEQDEWASSWIWKQKIPARWVTFLWLVLRDRLHTNELRLRRGIVESGACNRCGNQLETTAHVLRDCPFERRAWGHFEEAGRDPLFYVSAVSDWLKDNILVSKNALNSHDFGITHKQSSHWNGWSRRVMGTGIELGIEGYESFMPLCLIRAASHSTPKIIPSSMGAKHYLAREGSYDDYDLAEEIFWSSGVLEYGNEGDSQQLDAYLAQQLQFQDALLLSVKENIHSSESEPRESESSQSYCQICLESKERNLMFPISGCSHSFCSDCITMHVKTRLEENITRIMCPGENCRVMLGLEPFRPLLPKEVISLWDDLLCQKLVRETGGPIIYCPFKDCSAPFSNESQEIIKESECLSCNRLFCAQCHVPWHVGIDCEEFQKLDEDERGREDIMLRNLAKENKWIKCPSCHMMVEKTEGCIHMTCRCKFEFCYRCGAEWSEDHQGGCEDN